MQYGRNVVGQYVRLLASEKSIIYSILTYTSLWMEHIGSLRHFFPLKKIQNISTNLGSVFKYVIMKGNFFKWGPEIDIYIYISVNRNAY